MPLLPGEERLLIIFADVHYYFSVPTPRPLHHRFDKGSYVYLYEDATKRRSRLEIANNPGGPDQDAVHGTLNSAHLLYSYKFPTHLTITVDGPQQSTRGVSPPPDQSHEWRLASADPRDEGRFLFRLNTLELYFWTLEDATLFLDTAKRLLSSKQLDILDAPEASPQEVISPVVQQLENIAISDPAYRNGQTRNSRTQSTTLPPPPMAPPAPAQPSPQTPEPPVAKEPPPSFTPLVYNPAAPAAPEPIKHREKTPPPPDGAEGTGLAAAAAADHGFAPPPVQGSYFPGQPAAPYGSPPGVQHNPSVSSTASGHRQPSMPYAPPGTNAAAGQPARQSSVSFAPPPTQPVGHDPSAQLYGQSLPAPSPATQIFGSQPYGSPPGPHQPLQHLQPQYADYLQQQRAQQPQQPLQPPIGGFSNYSYAPSQEHHHHHHRHSGSGGEGGNEYDVHSQVYRPTEDEVKSHSKKHSSSAGSGQRRGKLEDQADKVDKSVSRFLKRLEKKIG